MVDKDLKKQIEEIKKSRKKNFLEYLGVEQQNTLTNMVNFRNEFDLFIILDGIYQQPLNRFAQLSDEQSAIILQLYYFVHISLYYSFSCLLRSHLLEALSPARKAIDATLTAYKIILEPSTMQEYLNRDNYFLHIKANIQKEINEDSSKYKMAHGMLKFYDLCSTYASHADIDSFALILSQTIMPNIKNRTRLFKYFQFSDRKEINQLLYITLLNIFLRNFLIFKKFFDSSLKLIDQEWETQIKFLCQEFKNLIEKLVSQIQVKAEEDNQ